MKRFILLNSPMFWEPLDNKEDYLPSIGLGYIATYLEKVGMSVEVLDCVKNRLSAREIINLVNSQKPDFLGINVFTQNLNIVKYIIENILNKCELFVGGQAVKSIYTEILKWKTNNEMNIIIGDGEFIIPSIVSGTCNQNPEIIVDNKKVYRVNKNSIYFPTDISNLDLNRKFLGDELIINHYRDEEISLVTSRGCDFNCAFCGGARSLNLDVPVRIRSSESIIKEIKEVLNIHPNVKSIRILDDLFLRNDESIRLANEIFNNFPQLSWRGMVHVLSLKKSIHMIDELVNSGCKELFIGIESGSEKIRRKINKVGTPEDVKNVITELLNRGIDVKGYFIYGFPGENKDDFQKTYELARELKEISKFTKGNFRPSVFQFRPYHGTKLYEEIREGTGIKSICEFNNAISKFEGRAQFNFSFGNYSDESVELLNEFIIKTQEITELN